MLRAPPDKRHLNLIPWTALKLGGPHSAHYTGEKLTPHKVLMWLPWGPTAGESIMTQAQEHTLCIQCNIVLLEYLLSVNLEMGLIFFLRIQNINITCKKKQTALNTDPKKPVR